MSKRRARVLYIPSRRPSVSLSGCDFFSYVYYFGFTLRLIRHACVFSLSRRSRPCRAGIPVALRFMCGFSFCTCAVFPVWACWAPRAQQSSYNDIRYWWYTLRISLSAFLKWWQLPLAKYNTSIVSSGYFCVTSEYQSPGGAVGSLEAYKEFKTPVQTSPCACFF